MSEVALEVRNVSKAFPGVQALDHVSFEIRDCAVDSSAGYGIYLDGDPGNLPDPDSLVLNNTFSGNRLGPVRRP